MRTPIHVALCALATLAATGPASAQTWPTRPVTVVVPFAAGSSTDTAARILTVGMSEALGQQVIVENIGGAAGMTGTIRVARAAPDGYYAAVRHGRHHRDRAGAAEEAALRQHQRFRRGRAWRSSSRSC